MQIRFLLESICSRLVASVCSELCEQSSPSLRRYANAAFLQKGFPSLSHDTDPVSMEIPATCLEIRGLSAKWNLAWQTRKGLCGRINSRGTHKNPGGVSRRAGSPVSERLPGDASRHEGLGDRGIPRAPGPTELQTCTACESVSSGNQPLSTGPSSLLGACKSDPYPGSRRAPLPPHPPQHRALSCLLQDTAGKAGAYKGRTFSF